MCGICVCIYMCVYVPDLLIILFVTHDPRNKVVSQRVGIISNRLESWTARSPLSIRHSFGGSLHILVDGKNWANGIGCLSTKCCI